MCQELPNLQLNDQTKKIFVNTKGRYGTITASQKSLIQYIDGGKLSDSYTYDLEQAVNITKNNEKWRKDYMTYAVNYPSPKGNGLVKA